MSKAKLYESVFVFLLRIGFLFSFFKQPAAQTDKKNPHQIDTFRDQACQKHPHPYRNQKQTAQPSRRCPVASSAHPITPLLHSYAEKELSCMQKASGSRLRLFLNLSI